MRKHVDGIALLVILLGFLAVTKAPNSCVLRGVNRAAVHLQNAIERIETRHLRDVVNHSFPSLR